MVVTLANYLKDSVVRTVTGCGQLWTNHGRCNEIRKKQNSYRAELKQQWEAAGLFESESPKDVQKRLQLQQGGITYDDYIFLQRGKEDRGKVLNLGFLIWGAPRFLPYALMFNPDMLPTPFQANKAAAAAAGGAESLAETLSRERAQAVMSTLMMMEKQAVAVSAGYLSSINIFGKKKQQETKSTLQTVVAETGEFFRRCDMPTAPAAPTASQLLERLAPTLYKTDSDFTRAEQRLCQVPACIVQGIGRAVSGQGVPSIVAQLTPAFLHRGKLVGHIQKVAAADDFLVQAAIDLETVPKRLLVEACQERLMDAGAHRSVDDLRASLAEWLQLTVPQPSAVAKAVLQIEPATPSLVEEQGSNVVATDTPTAPPVVYYNGNLARMMLMAYHSCAAVRDSRCTSRLPQLLYSGGSGLHGSSSNMHNNNSAKSTRSDAKSSITKDTKTRIPFLRN